MDPLTFLENRFHYFDNLDWFPFTSWPLRHQEIAVKPHLTYAEEGFLLNFFAKNGMPPIMFENICKIIFRKTNKDIERLSNYFYVTTPTMPYYDIIKGFVQY